MNRRVFLRASLTATAAWVSSCAAPRRARSVRTAANPLAEPFDREILDFMERRAVPGGAVAVVKDRRLIYARGYGWADRERQIPVTSRSLFRIASISKPITATAVLQLAEAGKLDLDAKAFALLPSTRIALGREGDAKTRDSRLDAITIRQLLQHTGGWDRGKSFDPMFRPGVIARALGTAPPAGPAEIIRYMLEQPLDFDPGTRYAYSNFGYCVLGRILEQITGEPYEAHVRRSVLAPCGIHDMRIGASLSPGQAKGEVRYYTREPDEADSVFPETTGRVKVPWPYGGFHLEAMDAHGGWIASAVDLVRFAAALDQPKQSPLLKPASFQTAGAPPAPPASRDPDGKIAASYYGCGWMVRPQPGDPLRANYWHSGSLPGTATLLVRRWDGLSWAVLFNQRSEDDKLPDSAIDPAMHRAAAAVKSWPDHDLFSEVE